MIGEFLITSMSAYMLQRYLVSNIFYSEENLEHKLNLNFIELLPCNKSLKAKQRKKGL